MKYFSRHDGTPLDLSSYLREAVHDIFTVEKGEMPGDREYGLKPVEFVDMPLDAESMHYEIQSQIEKYIPDFKISQTTITSDKPGSYRIELSGSIRGIREQIGVNVKA